MPALPGDCCVTGSTCCAHYCMFDSSLRCLDVPHDLSARWVVTHPAEATLFLTFWPSAPAPAHTCRYQQQSSNTMAMHATGPHTECGLNELCVCTLQWVVSVQLGTNTYFVYSILQPYQPCGAHSHFSSGTDKCSGEPCTCNADLSVIQEGRSSDQPI